MTAAAIEETMSPGVEKALARFHRTLGAREYDSWFPIQPHDSGVKASDVEGLG